MALTSTTLAAAVVAIDTSIVVTSATGYAAGSQIVCDQETMRVAQNYTSGTTIPVLRGQDGTVTAAHASGAGITVGVSALDWPVCPPTSSTEYPLVRSVFTAADLTATGATGSTATALPANAPGFISATGTSGAGVAVPTGSAVPGMVYFINNCTTGDLKIYAVGGTINGTTGTTAVTLTITGNKMGVLACTEAGAWRYCGAT